MTKYPAKSFLWKAFSISNVDTWWLVVQHATISQDQLPVHIKIYVAKLIDGSVELWT